MYYNDDHYNGGHSRHDPRFESPDPRFSGPDPRFGGPDPRAYGHNPYTSPPPHISHTNISYGPAHVRHGDMDIAKTFDHEPFRHTDPKYKCLCNKMHVKQGCRFIFAFLVGIIVLAFVLLFVNWNIGTWTTFIIHAILLAGIILCAFALFVAMKTEKEKLLLPVAGIAVLGAIISLIFFFFTIWSLIDPSGASGKLVNNFVVNQNSTQFEDQGLEANRDDIQTVSALTMVLSLLGLAGSIWVAFVVYKYYMYLKDMKFARVPKNQVHIEITDFKKGINQ